MAKKAKEIIFIPLPVYRSIVFIEDVKEIYLYGLETFGQEMAEMFYEKLDTAVSELKFQYFQHPECRHLSTKNRIYRNILLGKYLVIYKITEKQVVVLKAIHGSRSVSKIKASRKIKRKIPWHSSPGIFS